MPNFAFTAGFSPAGGQPEAIKKLAEGVDGGQKHQVLMGVTGSGKTMVVAQMIQEIQRPTLVMSPNKTLAAQLCSEFPPSFPRTPSSTSSATTTITSRKRISRGVTPILRKTRLETTRSTGCGNPRLGLC